MLVCLLCAGIILNGRYNGAKRTHVKKDEKVPLEKETSKIWWYQTFIDILQNWKEILKKTSDKRYEEINCKINLLIDGDEESSILKKSDHGSMINFIDSFIRHE